MLPRLLLLSFFGFFNFFCCRLFPLAIFKFILDLTYNSLCYTPRMEMKYPIRINKYLADKKHSTRRGTDELISQGRVLVNGRQAKLGEMINETDKVEIRYRSGNKKKLLYLAYNKPRGIVTHSVA